MNYRTVKEEVNERSKTRLHNTSGHVFLYRIYCVLCTARTYVPEVSYSLDVF
jgi:hypothetical protein